ncbi:hypothetical protein [Mycoplasmopsis alligatoris]|uniref:Uncharacterized protein n=1 Tax=Mycoplasmopsis alligatoris A21JP2 TaxID=747682 RepID=D4XWC1_9BACT|nr:hypothetical protein [Mycoplasmopsis alligatoris]EFF41216.1 hypothetical protein MALL_0510 [Mycoplasmopsis alligatoris A21JP2]
MDLLDVKNALVEVIKVTPGVKGLNVYDLVNTTVVDLNEEEWAENIFVEETSKGWAIRCAITILRGISAKNIVNEIHQQLNFKFKKKNKVLYKLNIMIKGVSDE